MPHTPQPHVPGPRHTQIQTEDMEGASRCTLGSQAQHTYLSADHTWSIQQTTANPTKQLHNIQQQNNDHTQTN